MAGRKRSAPGGGESNSRRTTRGSGSASSQNARDSNPFATTSTRRTRNTRTTTTGGNYATPDIVREMIRESRRESAAVAATSQNGDPGGSSSERPLKRRRPGERPPPKTAEPLKKTPPETESQELVKSTTSKLNIKDHEKNVGHERRPPQINEVNNNNNDDDDDDDDDDIEFEDVVIPAPTIQTIIQESDDEDDDQILFEDVDIVDPGGPSTTADDDEEKPMELNLTAQKALMNPRRTAIDRRKAITNDEKRRRVEIHKAHLLCLLAHVERRNRWCNDPEIQAALKPLLTDKIMRGLHPRTNQPQFGRSEALKSGIQEARNMFKLKFSITERGLRRSLWAEDPDQLKEYQLPDDMETTLEKEDFLEAAKSLSGSRDVGAQLFCAMLRSAGLDARLVCSLQPLPCVPGGGPAMPKNNKTPAKKPSQAEIYAAAVAKHENSYVAGASSSKFSPRRRLGHPNATAYNIPSIAPPPPPPPTQTNKKIRGESAYPIYWVEILDEAYQKYNPVDPLVTNTQWRPKALEPPSTAGPERLLNNMVYVIAFSADGSARDVTRRYVKAFNSKTKRVRIDGPVASRILNTIPGALSGERWWGRALKRYNPLRFREATVVEEIEASELVAFEAKEPMPRNVADFKDHPVYALERHLRRNEVLVRGAEYSGTVSSGKSSGGSGVEKIWRRRDVRVARSRDKWYRMGRVVLDGEEPVKILPPRKKGRRSVWDDHDDEPEVKGDEEEEEDDPERVGLFGDALVVAGGGIALFTEDQTRLYEPPPVGVDGRVPKNVFGNIDLYVASMLPRGGAHVDHPLAGKAAFILGVDYAPALTGWKFSGRRGTAVFDGVVVWREVEEAVWAVVSGLVYLEESIEMEKRRRRALRMWARWIKALRIRERVWGDEGGLEEIDVGLEGEGDDDDDGVEEGWGAEEGGGFFVGDIGGFDRAMNTTGRKGRKRGREAEYEAEAGGFVVDGATTGLGDDNGGGGGFMVDDRDQSAAGYPQREADDGGGGGGFALEDNGGGGFLVNDEPGAEGQADSGGGGFVVDEKEEDEEDEDVVIRTRNRLERSKDKGKGKALAVDDDQDGEDDEDVNMDDVPSDVSEEYFMDEDDEGGGFLIE